jgi:hypothetical protein
VSDLLNQPVTKNPVSSSNRESGDFDAVVVQNAILGGPVRLPLENVDSFVREFNTRYEKLGLSVQANKKSPATSEVDIAGDGWSIDSVGQRTGPCVS